MCGNIVCIAAAVLGVDAGWRPLPEGGMEYLIQIEPQLIETLGSGQAIQSEIPPCVKDVRAYRITVGTGALPRETPPPTAAPKVLPPEVAGRPIAQQTVYAEPAGAVPTPESKPAAHRRSGQQEPSRPWMPLMAVLFGLFASLGGNGYLFWIVRDGRRRYRELAHRLAADGTSAKIGRSLGRRTVGR